MFFTPPTQDPQPVCWRGMICTFSFKKSRRSEPLKNFPAHSLYNNVFATTAPNNEETKVTHTHNNTQPHKTKVDPQVNPSLFCALAQGVGWGSQGTGQWATLITNMKEQGQRERGCKHDNAVLPSGYGTPLLLKQLICFIQWMLHKGRIEMDMLSNRQWARLLLVCEGSDISWKVLH